jgi:hypothetical protein
MTVEPNLPGPEDHSPAGARPQAEAPRSPHDNAIPPAAHVPQPQAGTAPSAGARSPFDFRRLHPGDLIAVTASFLVLFPYSSRGKASRPLPPKRRVTRLSRRSS